MVPSDRMSWLTHHKASEDLATEAESQRRQRDFDAARKLYARAGREEASALRLLDPSKRRTLGILAVSATSLHYKAGQFHLAERLAAQYLASEFLPSFAAEELRNLLQTVWSEQVRVNASAQFSPGQLVVSLAGGQLLEGGAPLDLVQQKTKIIRALYYRTVEFLTGRPYRRRGLPSEDIRARCRPWLFNAAPGSYRFAVAIQDSRQANLFEADLASETLADSLLEILATGVRDPREGLSSLVSQSDYRTTFLKLTRNLAPGGEAFHRLSIQSPDTTSSISLDRSVRRALNVAIRETSQKTIPSQETGEVTIEGILRAVHLDKDWIEVSTAENAKQRVDGVGEQVDDVIGPLVNRPVVVHAMESGVRPRFLDIEPVD